MGLIQITGMEFFAFHGHYPEEKTSGHRFLLDLEMKTDTTTAEQSDDINDALNYQLVYVTVKNCIEQTNSNLLENIGKNILDALFKKFTLIELAKIKVSKMNPPMGGQIQSVSVSIERRR